MSAFKKNFASEIKRLQTLERQLRYFATLLDAERSAVTGRSLFDFTPHDAALQRHSLDELESRFDELESELRQLAANEARLDVEQRRCVEWKYALVKAGASVEKVRSLL